MRSSVRDGQKFPQLEELPEQQRQKHQKSRVCCSASSWSGLHFFTSNSAGPCASLAGNKLSHAQAGSERLSEESLCAPTRASPGNAQERAARRWIMSSLGLARRAAETGTLATANKAQPGAHWWDRYGNVSYCLPVIRFQPSAEAWWLRSSPPLVAVPRRSKAAQHKPSSVAVWANPICTATEDLARGAPASRWVGGWEQLERAISSPTATSPRERLGDVPARCLDALRSVGVWTCLPSLRSNAQKPRLKSFSGYRGWACKGCWAVGCLTANPSHPSETAHQGNFKQGKIKKPCWQILSLLF